VTSNCRIEIQYIDPEQYSSIVNHGLRKDVLRALYSMTKSGPITKQQLADNLRVGYHQLVYQLNNHLKDFWLVKEEQKVRGTRMELIEPTYPDTVFISLGKDNAIFMVDPLANLFGPLHKVGTRCDVCTPHEARRCVSYGAQGGCCSTNPSETEMALLMSNGRKPPFRLLDLALICAFRGIPEGATCSVEIPCDHCALTKKFLEIR
jgi:hypothetical protein